MAALALALAARAHATGIVSLTNTNNIGVLGLVGAAVANTGTTPGNVVATEGIASGSTLTISGAGTTKVVSGTVYDGTAGEVTAGNCGRASGGCVLDASDLASGSTLLNNISSLATTAGGLAATQTFGAISTTTTINAGATVYNVIDITSITNATVTLNGTASDFFIVNVSGDVSLNAGHSLSLSGGLLAANVLYNFTDVATMTVSLASGDTINGSILAPDSHITMNLAGTVNGMVIGGGAINLNGLVVNSAGNTWDGYPEPSTYLLLALGLGGLVLARKKLLASVQPAEAVTRQSRQADLAVSPSDDGWSDR